MASHAGNLFPQWKNSIFVGALGGRMLDRLSLSGKKVTGEEPLLLDIRTRIRDVRIGPEGAVYVLTDDRRLLEITPKVGYDESVAELNKQNEEDQATLAALDRAVRAADEGRVVPLEEVRQRMQQWPTKSSSLKTR